MIIKGYKALHLSEKISSSFSLRINNKIKNKHMKKNKTIRNSLISMITNFKNLNKKTLLKVIKDNKNL